MGLLISEISKSQFDNCSFGELFKNRLGNVMFGTITTTNGNGYKFSWQSTINKPKVQEISTNIYSMGIDLNFSVFNLEDDKILLNLDLDSFYYDTRIYHNHMYVISELEIIKIDTTDFNIVERYDLPDIFENIRFKEQKLEIDCMGGITITIDV